MDKQEYDYFVQIQELEKQMLTDKEKDFIIQLLTYIKVGKNKCFSLNEEAKELIESILKKWGGI